MRTIISKTLKSGKHLDINYDEAALDFVAVIDGETFARSHAGHRTQLATGPAHIFAGKIALTIPEGDKLFAIDHDEIQPAKSAAAAAKLEEAVPGVAKLDAAINAYQADQQRYAAAFAGMMEDEDNDGANPPRPTDDTLRQRVEELSAKHPRAALYLAARDTVAGTDWADNLGRAAAARRAMDVLMAGGSVEDAQAEIDRAEARATGKFARL